MDASIRMALARARQEGRSLRDVVDELAAGLHGRRREIYRRALALSAEPTGE
jgi:hypothetical protein